METTLYADVLFFVNFSMDFVSLWLTSLIISKRARASRMCASAGLGAVFGVISVIVNLSGALLYISAAAVSLLMYLTAFGGDGFFRLLRGSAVIWGCGAILGGAMTAIMNLFGRQNTAAGNPATLPPAAAAAAAAAYITVRIITKLRGKKELSVEVTHGKNTVTFSALCDSGNLLCDPISGTAVISVSHIPIEKLLGNNITEILLRCDTEEITKSNLRVRFIPHKTALGSSVGAAFLPEKAIVSDGKKIKKEIKCLILPVDCPEKFFRGYDATAPAGLL